VNLTKKYLDHFCLKIKRKNIQILNVKDQVRLVALSYYFIDFFGCFVVVVVVVDKTCSPKN